MQAIILAGGKGIRLRPYTTILPKPLLPIGEYMPVLEIIIRQLKSYGFNRLIFTVNHLARLIEAVFGDGHKWGVEISYSREEEPLGTAGPLGLLKDSLDDDFLVMNGDLLTDLNYKKLMNHHKKVQPIATIATFRKEVPISLGVLTIDKNNNQPIDYKEKPILTYQASAGIYILNKRILDYIKYDKYQDFPDLMRLLIKKKESLYCYQADGIWLDIGRPEDYQDANERFEDNPSVFLPEYYKK
jgi:NDP-sugar pyrophosphorylase family protein